MVCFWGGESAYICQAFLWSVPSHLWWMYPLFLNTAEMKNNRQFSCFKLLNLFFLFSPAPKEVCFYPQGQAYNCFSGFLVVFSLHVLTHLPPVNRGPHVFNQSPGPSHMAFCCFSCFTLLKILIPLNKGLLAFTSACKVYDFLWIRGTLAGNH